MVSMEFISRSGGRVRIHTDHMPKTPEEAKRRHDAMVRACVQCVASSVAMYGEEETINRMTNGPYAYLVKGRE